MYFFGDLVGYMPNAAVAKRRVKSRGMGAAEIICTVSPCPIIDVAGIQGIARRIMMRQQIITWVGWIGCIHGTSPAHYVAIVADKRSLVITPRCAIPRQVDVDVFFAQHVRMRSTVFHIDQFEFAMKPNDACDIRFARGWIDLIRIWPGDTLDPGETPSRGRRHARGNRRGRHPDKRLAAIGRIVVATSFAQFPAKRWHF
jgi:hypothetical protein